MSSLAVCVNTLVHYCVGQKLLIYSLIDLVEAGRGVGFSGSVSVKQTIVVLIFLL